MKLALLDTVRHMFGAKNVGLMAGIAVHQKCVRVVIGRLKGSQWHYVAHDEVEVTAEEQWRGAIKSLIAKHQLQDAHCCVVLPPNRYQLLQIDKPQIPDEELAMSLGWHIKDLVSIAQDDMVADYFNVPVKNPSQGEKINVVVTSRKIIMGLISVFNKLKVELDGIVPEEMVIRNIIGCQENASLLLSQQKNEEMALQIVKQDQIYFARKLRGFNRIHEYGREEISAGLSDSLSLEVQRSMDYFDSQLKQAPVKTIQLALPSEHQSLIAEQISANFPAQVQILAPDPESIKIEETLSEQFFPALGGALEFMPYRQEGKDAA